MLDNEDKNDEMVSLASAQSTDQSFVVERKIADDVGIIWMTRVGNIVYCAHSESRIYDITRLSDYANIDGGRRGGGDGNSIRIKQTIQ